MSCIEFGLNLSPIGAALFIVSINTGAYMSESFPTAVRGTGLSTAYNMGRIGSMAAPMMIGLVSAQYSIAFF